MAGLFVTNMHRNFTGVSATTAAVVREQARTTALQLVGFPLPGCPAPISYARALRLSARRPEGLPFSIWHVRRNEEMRAGLFARHVLRLPVRLVFTSAAQRRHSAWPRFLISRMDAIIATTPEAASYVKNVRAIAPHGVDTERFHPAQSRENAWRATGYPGTAGIAAIGRIRPEKGTDRFVGAMIAALPRLPGMTALVIGRTAPRDAGFLESLRKRVAEAGLENRILFPGEIDAKAMPALVRALSLLVALPRYEGYGLTPLEAMASSVPFVASDTGHFADFSGAGAAGRIVPNGDADAAAKEVVDILSAPGMHAAMASAARQRAVEHFSVAREAATINCLYDALWAEGGRA